MTEYEKDRIECAIRHIQTAVDVDPWAVEIAVEAMEAQLSREDTTSDLISRQEAVDALWEIRQEEISDGRRFHDYCSLSTAVDVIKDLPSASEPSIPVAWIEKHVDWLKNMDNGFATLTAMNISTMVKKWKKEQEEADGSDKQTGGDGCAV